MLRRMPVSKSPYFTWPLSFFILLNIYKNNYKINKYFNKLFFLICILTEIKLFKVYFYQGKNNSVISSLPR